MDLVERLRSMNVDFSDRAEIYSSVKNAADEIERLRGALEKVCAFKITDPNNLYGIQMQNIARAALNQQGTRE